MTHNPQSILSLLFLLNLLLSLHTVAGRNVPTKSNDDNMKKPDSFIDSDGSVLIPGIGRAMVPKIGKGFNPFTYNPITGTDGGTGISFGSGTGAGAGRSYIPGGDDTFVPNPGVYIPIPGGIGGVPQAARP